jgi:hypothetical protein
MPSQVERALAGDAAMTPIAMDVAKASHHHECRARRRLVFKSHLRFFFVSDKVVKKQKGLRQNHTYCNFVKTYCWCLLYHTLSKKSSSPVLSTKKKPPPLPDRVRLRLVVVTPSLG